MPKTQIMPLTESILDLQNPIIAQQREVIESEEIGKFIESWMLERQMEKINDSWQPHDILPNRIRPGYRDEEEAILMEAARLPRELIIATVFHHVTEENLPGYMRALNMFMTDYGGEKTPRARWQTIWVRQEKRHGQSSHGYLYLSGRVDMSELDRVIGHQIQNGFNMNVDTLYDCFVYTADQERNTKKTHGRTGREAHKCGGEKLSQICTTVTVDEALHERFYVDLFREIFKKDSNGAMIAFRDMMKKGIIMPSLLIDDGRMRSTARQPKMFLRFGRVDEHLGVFDYYQDSADDMAYFMRAWDIEHQEVSGEGARAQEELPKIYQGYLQEAEAKRTKTIASKKPNLSAFDILVPPR